VNTSKEVSSPSVAPDLDWSQVSETVRMLDLAIAQISMAIHDGDDSVDSLTSSFTHMVSSVDRIADVARETGLQDQAASDAILEQCAQVRSGMQHSIVAFQFYDRHSQRLDQVRDALAQLGRLVSEPARLYNPGEWHLLQQQIRSRYSLAGEQRMFDALLNGASIEEALDAAGGDQKSDECDSIELF